MTAINYETIIKYLMPKINTFSLMPNITMTSSNFTSYNNLFDDSFYRFGIINTHDGINISLKSSILACIYSKYNMMSSEDISKFEMTDNMIDLCNNLGINIIFFNFINNITSSYKGDFFNPWIPTIYIATNGEWFEPIITKDCRIFSFSSIKSNILKNNILCQNILKYNINENITINDNFNEIIEIDKFTKPIIKEENDTFITAEPTIPTKSKLEKMKKEDLLTLIQQLNKTVSVSKPTKKDLIDIIYT